MLKREFITIIIIMIKKIDWLDQSNRPTFFFNFHWEQLATVNFTTFWSNIPYFKALYPAVLMDIRLLPFIKN